MKKLILIFVVLFSSSIVLSQDPKTYSEINTRITSQFPDNTTGLITPEVIRNFLSNYIVESLGGREYQSTTTYEAGKSFVYYSGDLYICKTNISIPEAFSPSKWRKLTYTGGAEDSLLINKLFVDSIYENTTNAGITFKDSVFFKDFVLFNDSVYFLGKIVFDILESNKITTDTLFFTASPDTIYRLSFNNDTLFLNDDTMFVNTSINNGTTMGNIAYWNTDSSSWVQSNLINVNPTAPAISITNPVDFNFEKLDNIGILDYGGIGRDIVINNTGTKNTPDLGSGTTVILGSDAASNQDGMDNTVIIGASAGSSLISSGSNTLLGYNSGDALTGNGNIFIGANSGATLTAVDSALVIDNTNTTTPLIYGKFDSNYVYINGELKPVRLKFDDNIKIGVNAFTNETLTTSSIAIGNDACLSTITSNRIISIGDSAMYNAQGCTNLTSIGYKVGGAAISSDNTVIIGDNSGELINDLDNSIIIGTGVANNMTSSINNIMIGDGVAEFRGANNDNNIMIGNDAGSGTSGSRTGSDYNVLIGTDAGGGLNSNCDNNIAIGRNAGASAGADNISNNVAIGTNAGQIIAGNNNTFVGTSSGSTSLFSENNTTIGYQSLFSNVGGDTNTVVGYKSGYGATGSRNVFLGSFSGYNETGDDNLYIDNSNTSTPLIYGKFDSNYVAINDSVIARSFVMNREETGVYIGRQKPTSLSGDDNIFITRNPISGATTMSRSVVIGGEGTGSSMVSSNNSTIVGSGAATSLTTENSVTVIGRNAYMSGNGQANTVGGADALRNDTLGIANSVWGRNSCKEGQYNYMSTLGNNSFMGTGFTGTSNMSVGIGYYAAGETNFSQDTSVFVGAYSGFNLGSAGRYNSILGAFAAYQASGSNNGYFGYRSGYTNTGDGCLWLGYRIGDAITNESNTLRIGRNDTTLIYADFIEKDINFNGNVGIGTDLTPNAPLEIEINQAATTELRVVNSNSAWDGASTQIGLWDGGTDMMFWQYNNLTHTGFFGGSSSANKKLCIGIKNDTAIAITDGQIEVREPLVSTDTTNLYKICGGLVESTTTNVSATTTYKTITGLDESTCCFNVTATDSSLTLPTNGAGMYTILFNGSFSSSANNIEVEGALFVNDVEQNEIEFRRTIGTTGATSIGSVGFSHACYTLDGSDVLKVKIKIDTGTATITWEKLQFTLVRVN